MFLFLWPLFTHGQKTTVSTTADTTKNETVINDVPLANIGNETEVTINTLRDIKEAIKKSKTEIDIDSVLPKNLMVIEKMQADLDLEKVRTMTLRQTENLKNDIIQLRIQFEGWRDLLQKRVEFIGNNQTLLDQHQTQWTKTLDKKRDSPLPPQVKDRVKANLIDIEKLNQQLVRYNDDLLTKQDKITGALLYLEEVKNAITSTQETFRSRFFNRDSPPLWHMFQATKDTLSLREKVIVSVSNHNKKLVSFIDNYQDQMAYHLIFFAILLILAFYLKREISDWSDDKKEGAVKFSLVIVDHPAASALLVSLLFTDLFYQNAPDEIINYFYVLLIWPIISILPGLVPNIPKRYFYVFACVLLVSLLSQYFSDLVLLDRIFLILLDGITLWWIIALLQHKIATSDTINGVFVFLFARIGIFFIALSILLNILGNTIMARIISQGTFSMIYGGAIIFATSLTIKGIFALSIKQKYISKLNMVIQYPEEIQKNVFQFVRLLAIAYWVYLTTSSFLVFDPAYNWTENLLIKEWEVGSVTLTIGSVLAFFIVLWISFLLSKFIRFILEDEILTHFEMPRGVPGAISMVVRLVIIIFGFILAFGAAKIDMNNIAIIFGALGVGIGFGLQNIFNNLVSGLILAFERPIQVGDVIQISTLNLMGEVKEIGFRASTVRTFDGAEVIVPNGNLISNEMVNWTLSDQRRRQEIIVGVAYGTNTNKVLELLNEIVAQQTNVLKTPNPFITFLGFGESSLDFRILFWTHFKNGMSTKSNVGIAIDEAFREAGIIIPFPQRDLHIKSSDANAESLSSEGKLKTNDNTSSSQRDN